MLTAIFLLLLSFLPQNDKCVPLDLPVDNLAHNEIVFELDKPMRLYQAIIIDGEPVGSQIGLPDGDTNPWEFQLDVWFYNKQGEPIIGQIGVHQGESAYVSFYGTREKIARIEIYGTSGSFQLEQLTLLCE